LESNLQHAERRTAMFLRISHRTRYDYSSPVSFAPHALYLRPRESSRQRVHDFTLAVTPAAARNVATTDAEDNALDWAYFAPDTLSAVLEFCTEFLVETLDANPFDFFLKPSASAFPFAYDSAERTTLASCLTPPSSPAPLRAWLAQHLPSPPRDTVAFLTALNTAVRASLAYSRRDEPGIQNAAETLARGGGSCRDYAVVLIELCRLLGLAARFASGYLHESTSADAKNPPPSAMHAWTEVYLPGAGWRGLDPTRGIFCDDAFVPIAHSVVAESVNPIQGSFYSAVPATSKLSTQLTVSKF
jgi:transglutaminase-like putative cysteine protease